MQETFEMPDRSTLVDLTAAAVLTVAGAMAFAWAYARAEAQVLVPLEYSGFLWASLFGWIFFTEKAHYANDHWHGDHCRVMLGSGAQTTRPDDRPPDLATLLDFGRLHRLIGESEGSGKTACNAKHGCENSDAKRTMRAITQFQKRRHC